jgi:NTE family protein
VIISDGSGQMVDDPKPATRLPAVLRRSANIASDTVRDEQLVRTEVQRSVDECEVLHLRKGIDARVVRPGETRAEAGLEREADLNCTAFGVHPKVQTALSRVRTDLDAFSRVEASSLELDGYRMASFVLNDDPARWEAVGSGGTVSSGSWVFEEVGQLIATDHPRYLKLLQIAHEKFRRPTRIRGLAQGLWSLAVAIGLAVVLGAVYLLRDEIGDLLNTGIEVWVLLVALVVIAAVGWLYTRWNTASKVFFSAITPPLLLIAAVPLWLYAAFQIQFSFLLAKLDEIPEPNE